MGQDFIFFEIYNPVDMTFIDNITLEERIKYLNEMITANNETKLTNRRYALVPIVYPIGSGLPVYFGDYIEKQNLAIENYKPSSEDFLSDMLNPTIKLLEYKLDEYEKKIKSTEIQTVENTTLKTDSKTGTETGPKTDSKTGPETGSKIPLNDALLLGLNLETS